MFLSIKLQTLNMSSSSTVDNIMKRFWESGEIYVCKGQGQNIILDAPPKLQGLRWHCIKNRHDSVMDIAAWAQEYFRTSLSEHSLQCHPKKQGKALLCKEKAISENYPEIPSSSFCQSSFKMIWCEVENGSVVRRIKILHSFWQLWVLRPLS